MYHSCCLNLQLNCYFILKYLVALAKLRKSGFEPTRNIYITFLPDEEIGGIDGMNVLTESDWFNSVKIAVALDEGLASEGDDFKVFYGERLPWWVRGMHCLTRRSNSINLLIFISLFEQFWKIIYYYYYSSDYLKA